MKNRFLEKAKSDVQQAYTRDAYLIQAVRSLDDLDQTKSLLFQRMDEWFRIHFPEMKLENEETYAFFVAHASEHDAFGRLAALVGEPKALELKALKEKSFGAPLEADDAKALADMAHAYEALSTTRTHLEKYIETISRQIMPNCTALCGALVSARLLSIAGSLLRLANFPASTLQVLGAEKALFKHLRKHTLPPKHGVIFQVPYVNAQPFDKRGKAARALAAKLAIALKADFYSKHDISKKLLADLYKREEQINALPTRNIQPKDYRERDYQARKSFGRGGGGAGFKKPFREREGGDRPYQKPFREGPRRFDDRPPRPHSDRPFGERPRGDGPRRPYSVRPQRSYSDRPRGDDARRPYSDRPRRPYSDRPSSGPSERQSYGDRPPAKRRFENRDGSSRPRGDRPDSGSRSYGDRPSGGSKPYGDRPQSGYQKKPFRKKPFKKRYND